MGRVAPRNGGFNPLPLSPPSSSPTPARKMWLLLPCLPACRERGGCVRLPGPDFLWVCCPPALALHLMARCLHPPRRPRAPTHTPSAPPFALLRSPTAILPPLLSRFEAFLKATGELEATLPERLHLHLLTILFRGSGLRGQDLLELYVAVSSQPPAAALPIHFGRLTNALPCAT
jgi:hypothetical protein